MRYLSTFFLLFLLTGSTYAQHYGGLVFSPILTKNKLQNKNWPSSITIPEESELTWGYSLGYQGLLMENRRFSFTYGIQYSRTYNKYYGNSSLLEKYDFDKNAIGIKQTFHTLELPATIRYNLLKNKRFQPYFSLTTTFVLPIKTTYAMINPDMVLEPIPFQYTDKIHLHFDLGAGFNYRINERMMLNFHATYRHVNRFTNRFSAGLSFMYKF